MECAPAPPAAFAGRWLAVCAASAAVAVGEVGAVGCKVMVWCSSAVRHPVTGLEDTGQGLPESQLGNRLIAAVRAC